MTHLAPTDDDGPLRDSERYATAEEYEGHLNGPDSDRIPGARWVRDLPEVGDPSFSLAVPLDRYDSWPLPSTDDDALAWECPDGCPFQFYGVSDVTHHVRWHRAEDQLPVNKAHQQNGTTR